MKKLETRKEILDYLGELSKEKNKRMDLIIKERAKISEEEGWNAERMTDLILEFKKLNIENHLLNEIQMTILGREL